MAFFDIFKRNKEQRGLTDDYCQTALSGLNLVNFHSNNSMSLSAIYSAIELISNTLAEIPIEVKQRDEGYADNQASKPNVTPFHIAKI